MAKQQQQASSSAGSGTGMTAVAGCRMDQAMRLQVN